VIQCPICQVDNDDQAQFCLECGGRLSPKVTAQQPMPQLAPDTTKPEPPKPRRKLHSPILGGPESDFDDSGYDDFDRQDDSQDFEASRPRGKKSSPSQSKKGGLRSPLLSAGDDDYDADLDDDNDYNDFNGHPNKGKKGGLRSPLLGGGGGGGGGKTEFPHRHQNHGNRPQMEGADHDFEEQMQEPTLKSKAGGASKSHHLRSPLLSGDDYEEEFEDDYYDEDDAAPADPNALRSPLLAARSPRHEKPQATAPTPRPAAMPQSPQGQPNYQPQRAPSPTQSQLNLAQQAPPAPLSAPPAPPAPPVQSPVQSSTSPTQQQTSERRISDTDRRSVTRPGSDRRMSSRLLSGSSSTSTPDPDFDDYDDMPPGKPIPYKGASSSQANAFAPLLVAAAGCAAFAKLWYLSGQLGNPRLFTTYLSAFVDQVASIAVLVMLMLFAINANKK